MKKKRQRRQSTLARNFIASHSFVTWYSNSQLFAHQATTYDIVWEEDGVADFNCNRLMLCDLPNQRRNPFRDFSKRRNAKISIIFSFAGKSTVRLRSLWQDGVSAGKCLHKVCFFSALKRQTLSFNEGNPFKKALGRWVAKNREISTRKKNCCPSRSKALLALLGC